MQNKIEEIKEWYYEEHGGESLYEALTEPDFVDILVKKYGEKVVLLMSCLDEDVLG